MKKKELMLDFTSLLDVILILLFIVIGNMNHSAMAAEEEFTTQLTQAETRIQALDAERERLTSQLEAMHISEEENAALSEELAQLKGKYAALMDEYDHLKIITDYDENDVSVYRAAIEKITRAVLICNAGPDVGAGNHQVTVDIYIDEAGEGQQAHVGSVAILHDFSLYGEERERLIAEQTIDMTKALSAALRDHQGKMAWFSIQYSYNDANIANSDIEIINRAIDNLEHSFGIPCYAEEMKIY